MLNKGNVCLFNSSVQNFLFMIHSVKFKPQQQSMSSCILLSRSDMAGGSKKCQFTLLLSLDTWCLRSLIIAFSLLWVTSVPKGSKPCDGRLWISSLISLLTSFLSFLSYLSFLSFSFFCIPHIYSFLTAVFHPSSFPNLNCSSYHWSQFQQKPFLPLSKERHPDFLPTDQFVSQILRPMRIKTIIFQISAPQGGVVKRP